MSATIIRESIEEFLARDGKINKLDNGSKQTATTSQLVSRDKQLAALRSLLKDMENRTDDSYAKVQAAIDKRIQILKSC